VDRSVNHARLRDLGLCSFYALSRQRSGTERHATPVQVPALLTEALEIPISRFYSVTTLLANKPSFQLRQHGPEVIAQNAVGAAHNLLSPFSFSFAQRCPKKPAS
jgi:hypothetical protein